MAALRILILEDDEDLAEQWVATFSAKGHSVSHALSHSSAVQAIAESPFDVLVIDLLIRDESGELQDRGGISLLSGMRLRYPTGDGPKRIVVTGAFPDDNSDADVLAMSRAMGADLALRKPIAPEDLVRRIEALVSA